MSSASAPFGNVVELSPMGPHPRPVPAEAHNTLIYKRHPETLIFPGLTLGSEGLMDCHECGGLQ